MKRLFAASILMASMMVVLSSCGESAGSGEEVTIPTMSVSCSGCGVAGKPLFIWITPFNCDPTQVNNAVASWVGTCSGSSCSTSTAYGSWGNDHGTAITSVPSGTYSVCGLIDRNNDDISSGNYNDDLSTVISNQSITGTSGSIFMTTWN